MPALPVTPFNPVARDRASGVRDGSNRGDGDNFAHLRADYAAALEWRNSAITQFMPLVRGQVNRIMPRLPPNVARDEVHAAALAGMVDAADQYRPQFGVPFAAYARTRVRGAIVDYLRAQSWSAARGVHRDRRWCEGIDRLVADDFGWPLGDEAVAQATGLSLARVWVRRRRAAHGSAMIPLSAVERPASGNGGHQTIDPVGGEDGLPQLLSRDFLDYCCRGLNQAERAVIVGYYLEGLTMQQIGVVVGLTESRVSQIHERVLERLRQRLAGRKLR